MAFSVGAITGLVKLDTRQIKTGISSARSMISAGSVAIGTLIGNLASRAVSGIVGLVKSAVGEVRSFFAGALDASKRFEAAMMGLKGVGRKLGIEMDDLKRAAKELTSDGLLTMSEASLGLKNLLAKGFNLEQASKLMNTFKDSAAFGRQAALSFGEAVVSATEGIKNENSILVDNAGITKNLSVILKESGFQLQDLSDKTKGAAARQALFNGLIEEGAISQGDAARVSETLSGSQSRLKQVWDELGRAVGDILAPAMKSLIDKLIPLIEATRDWFNLHKPELTLALEKAVNALGGGFEDLATWISTSGDDLSTLVTDGIKKAIPALINVGTYIGTLGDQIELVGIKAEATKKRLGVGLLSLEEFGVGAAQALGGPAAIVLNDVRRDLGDFADVLAREGVTLEMRQRELEERIAESRERMAKRIQDAVDETGRKERKRVDEAAVNQAALMRINEEEQRSYETIAEAVSAVGRGLRGLPLPMQHAGDVIFNVNNIFGTPAAETPPPV